MPSCREWLEGVWSEAGAGGLRVRVVGLSRGSVGAVVAVPRARAGWSPTLPALPGSLAAFPEKPLAAGFN